MKFCVCIKQVPDVTTSFQIRDGELVFDAERLVLNAYDASAVEEALVLTEQYGGDVEVVIVGTDKAREAITKALAMGADRATHLKVEDDEGFDSMAYSEVLAYHFADTGYDAIFCGKQSQDTDAGLTGAMLAEWLDLPYTTNAVGLEWEEEDAKLIVTRQGDTGQEIVVLPAPCLVTCSNDMNEPRIPNIKGIMQAKRKPVRVREVEEAVTPKTRVFGYEPIPEREAGPKLEGEPEELAHELCERLDEENVL